MNGKHKITRKAVTLFMAIVMVFTTLAVPSMAKSKVKLSKTKLTITSGKSTTIKLSGTSKKAKWYVSGKKLVTIKTKGKKRHKATIKAGKKTGKCTVKVKFGKKTLKCTVTVKAKKKPAPEFKEKPLSEFSENLTSSYTRISPEVLAADDSFISAYTVTSLKMLKYLNSLDSNTDKNILISPDSILTCMAMTEMGAAGTTLSEMRNAFGGLEPASYYRYLYTLNERLTNMEDAKYNIADSIWFKNGGAITLKNSFLQNNVDYFNSEIYATPFDNNSVSDMNNWVHNHTMGMIPSIIDRLAPKAKVALINAIAFEGLWAEPYETAEPGSFKTDAGIKQTAPILDGFENTYVSLNGANGFVKNYKGGKIAFMGIETPKGKTVNEFLASLSASDLITAYNARSSTTKVHTWMPEFNYDYDTELIDTMKQLGIVTAFTNMADFSEMSDHPLMIDRIIHKTHIELTKTGTKAAAATAAVAKDSAVLSPGVEPKEVDLRHPFVYALIDTETGIPLFIGAVKTVA